jgi:hypothetical protein
MPYYLIHVRERNIQRVVGDLMAWLNATRVSIVFAVYVKNAC